MTQKLQVLCGIPFVEDNGGWRGWLPSADLYVRRTDTQVETILNGSEIFWTRAPQSLEEAVQLMLKHAQMHARKLLAAMEPKDGFIYSVNSTRARVHVLGPADGDLNLTVKDINTGAKYVVKVYEILLEAVDKAPASAPDSADDALQGVIDHLRKQVAANMLLAVTSKTHRGAADAYADVLQRVEALIRKPPEEQT